MLQMSPKTDFNSIYHIPDHKNNNEVSKIFVDNSQIGRLLTCTSTQHTTQNDHPKLEFDTSPVLNKKRQL